MNILSKNRILQKGDEYRNNGTWTPVPKDNFGLQVQFTDYKEVRRPSEKPSLSRETPETARDERTEVPKRVVSPAPISPKQAADKIATPVAAEKEKTPVPTPSGTGESLPEIKRLVAAVEHLPTVISTKAHSRKHDGEISVNCQSPTEQMAALDQMAALEREAKREMPTYDHTGPAPFPKGEIEKAIEKAKLLGASNGHIKIKFPNSGPVPIWTGRNGTFNGYGLEASTVGDMVLLYPVGKRGVGNCMIQFPVAIIPQLIDWLLRNQK
jgi:hypothetical protein